MASNSASTSSAGPAATAPTTAAPTATTTTTTATATTHPAPSPSTPRDELKESCAEAVREELAKGLDVIRQIVREELDRDEEEEETDEEEESEEESDDGDGRETNPKLVICVRCDLKMSTGKVAAQVGHAVHHAITESRWRMLRSWETLGAKKVTLGISSEEELRELKAAARKGGLVAESIRDAGHTEVAPGTTTVLAIGPDLPKSIDAITGHLKPLPDRAKQLEQQVEKFKSRAERLQKELDESKKKNKQLLKLMRAAQHYI